MRADEKSSPSMLKISYNNVWGNSEGDYSVSFAIVCVVEDSSCGPRPFVPAPAYGEMSADPLFAIGRDFHLSSEGGRYAPGTGEWVTDAVTSPCVDAGDPTAAIGHEAFANGGVVNMGGYGGTVQASKSYFGKPPCEKIFAGDINGDCVVDLKDLGIMTMHWLEGYGL